MRAFFKWFRRSYTFHADDHVFLAAVLLEEEHELEVNSALAHARIIIDKFEHELKTVQNCRELYKTSRQFSPRGHQN